MLFKPLHLLFDRTAQGGALCALLGGGTTVITTRAPSAD
jgi:hypothetical protein